MLRVVHGRPRHVQRAPRREQAAARIERVGGVERDVRAALVAERELAEEAELVPGVGVLGLELRRLLVEPLGFTLVARERRDGGTRVERLR